MTRNISSTTTGARPSEGSSKRMRRGAPIRQRPIASICCSPPESVPALCRRRSASRGKSAITRSIAALAPARARGITAPISRFSMTVMVGKIWRPSGTWPMPRSQMRCEGCPAISTPSKAIEPRRGFSIPAIARISEVLPAPFEPMMATISSASTSSETPSSAWASP